MQFNLTSDSDLVFLCKGGEREAWNEFFRRYIPLIKSWIRQTLKVYDAEEISYSGLDIVSEILIQLVNKLYPAGILDQLSDPSGLRPWLKTVVSNLTIDWLKSQGRLKHATRREIECRMRSLDEPLSKDSEATLTDILVIDADAESSQDLHNYLEILLQTIETKANRRDFWIVRLSIISQIPLDSEEEAALTDFSPLPPAAANKLIQSMTEDVERRAKQFDAKRGLAIVLGSQLLRLQHIAYDMRGDDTPHGLVRVKQLEQECNEIEARRDKLLVEGRKIPRPRNTDIAALVGILPQQESLVTTVLKRSREKLRALPVTT